MNKRVLLLESDALAPVPVGHLNIVRKAGEWRTVVDAAEGQVQCVVGRNMEVGFGESQCPGLSDYADGVDTWKLLTEGLSQDLVGDK